MNANYQTELIRNRLNNAGVAADFTQANILRRAQITLHGWAEKECGTGNGCIERDESTDKCYWLNSMTGNRYQVRDMETPALKRVSEVCAELGAYFYHQGDPRGCALYVSAEPINDQSHNRGVAICL